MKNSKLLTATAVFSVAITAAITTMSLTSAYRGNSGENIGQGLGNKNPQVSEEQREAMHEALENQDYEAWLELAPENGRKSDLTKAEFKEFAEKKLERIDQMETRRAEMEEKRLALNEAFANNDYESWKEIITESGNEPQILEVINAENFDELVKIHNLKQEGQAKFEEARELEKELGIERKHQFGQGKMHKKMGRGLMNHFQK